MLVIVGCWGCAGDLKDPERFNFLLDSSTKADAAMVSTTPPAPPACMTTLFSMSCGLGTTCHAAGGLQRQADLVSPDVAARLLGVESKTDACEGHTLVATDGGDSLLLQKVSGDMPPCGSAMPPGSKLSADDLSCITGWVDAVAKAGGGS